MKSWISIQNFDAPENKETSTNEMIHTTTQKPNYHNKKPKNFFQQILVLFEKKA